VQKVIELSNIISQTKRNESLRNVATDTLFQLAWVVFPKYYWYPCSWKVVCDFIP